MKKQVSPNIAIFIFVVLCVISCKKKKNDNPFGNTKIATVDLTQYGATTHSRLVYDINNNVDSIITTGPGLYHYKKFGYFGTSYNVTDENNYTFEVEANASGMILKILVTDTMSMIYNGNQLGELDTKTASPIYPYYVKSSVNYTWSNGDVATMGSQTYVYDPGKSGQPGDAIRIDQFLAYGRSYIKTTHLPTDLKNNATDTVEKYFYQFDAGGRISQLTKLTNISGGVGDSTIYVFGY